MQKDLEKIRELAGEVDQLDAVLRDAMPVAFAIDDKTFFAGGVCDAIGKSRVELGQIIERLLKAVALAEKELAEQQQAKPEGETCPLNYA